jgi:hypothetical protein
MRPDPRSYGNWQDWADALLKSLVDEEPIPESTTKLRQIPEGRLPTLSAKQPGQLVHVISPLGPASDWVAWSKNGAWVIL